MTNQQETTTIDKQIDNYMSKFSTSSRPTSRLILQPTNDQTKLIIPVTKPTKESQPAQTIKVQTSKSKQKVEQKSKIKLREIIQNKSRQKQVIFSN